MSFRDLATWRHGSRGRPPREREREDERASRNPARGRPIERTRGLSRFVLATCLLAAAAGCATGGKEEEAAPDAVAELTLIAMDDVNPNVASVPSPIVVVFYELAEPQAFEGAKFSQLFYDDGSALGADVRERLEFRVEPGQIIRTKRVLDPETRHLGFVAGYREIENAQWRIRADVAPSATRAHTLVVGARSLSLPDSAPGRTDDAALGASPPDEERSGMLDGLTDFMKGIADAVLPGSE